MGRVGRAGSIGVALAVVLVLASCAAPAPWTPPPPSPGSVTVMSFNIRHGVGTDNLLDLDRIARVVAASGAELVGLQEVDRHFGTRSNFVDQATYLADSLGMEVVFGANLDLDPLAPGEARRQYGNAILSRHPITGWDNTLLPRLPTSEQRGLLHATLDVDGTPVEAYATHLQFDSPAERLQQVQAILGTIGGPRSPAWSCWATSTRHRTPPRWPAGGPAHRCMGAGRGGRRQHVLLPDPDQPDRYVLTSRERDPVRTAAVIASDVSDHRPVVASLTLPDLRLPPGPPLGRPKPGDARLRGDRP